MSQIPDGFRWAVPEPNAWLPANHSEGSHDDAVLVVGQRHLAKPNSSSVPLCLR